MRTQRQPAAPQSIDTCLIGGCVLEGAGWASIKSRGTRVLGEWECVQGRPSNKQNRRRRIARSILAPTFMSTPVNFVKSGFARGSKPGPLLPPPSPPRMSTCTGADGRLLDLSRQPAGRLLQLQRLLLAGGGMNACIARTVIRILFGVGRGQHRAALIDRGRCRPRSRLSRLVEWVDQSISALLVN
jgi:hypothetical protein